jgi:hypothetical protein
MQHSVARAIVMIVFFIILLVFVILDAKIVFLIENSSPLSLFLHFAAEKNVKPQKNFRNCGKAGQRNAAGILGQKKAGLAARFFLKRGFVSYL